MTMINNRKRDSSGIIKTVEEETTDGQDLLSELPESLIIEILSLIELKNAIKTGILAKSWKYHWTNVHNILLYRFNKESVSSVDHTLITQCNTLYIHTFDLIATFHIPPVVMDKWISFALHRNVNILKLTYSGRAPEHLFHSSSITTLELCHVEFTLASPANMPSLKILRLKEITVDEDCLDDLLMGCPVLEELIIDDNSSVISYLDIMSPSVKRFKLHEFHYPEKFDDDGFLSIKAPWLRELEISGRFLSNQCQFVDVSSLTKATFIFHTHFRAIGVVHPDELEYFNNHLKQYCYEWIPMVTELLNTLSYVGELTIGLEPIQVLSSFKLLGTPSPLFMCKQLSIETHLWKFDLPGIACLLENAPHLESLVIKVLGFWQDMYPLEMIETIFQDGEPHLSMAAGKFMHLKNVKVDYSRWSCRDSAEDNRGECFDFELVEYILNSVVDLEKLVLCSSSGSCYNISCQSPSCAFQYVPRLSSKLLSTVLSGNEDAADWELKKSKNKFVFTFSNYASLRPTGNSLSASCLP